MQTSGRLQATPQPRASDFSRAPYQSPNPAHRGGGEDRRKPNVTILGRTPKSSDRHHDPTALSPIQEVEGESQFTPVVRQPYRDFGSRGHHCRMMEEIEEEPVEEQRPYEPVISRPKNAEEMVDDMIVMLNM